MRELTLRLLAMCFCVCAAMSQTSTERREHTCSFTWLGFTIADPEHEAALNGPSGVLVTKVELGSIGDSIGLISGDRIRLINGEPVTSCQTFVTKLQPGQEVTMRVADSHGRERTLSQVVREQAATTVGKPVHGIGAPGARTSKPSSHRPSGSPAGPAASSAAKVGVNPFLGMWACTEENRFVTDRSSNVYDDVTDFELSIKADGTYTEKRQTQDEVRQLRWTRDHSEIVLEYLPYTTSSNARYVLTDADTLSLAYDVRYPRYDDQELGRYTGKVECKRGTMETAAIGRRWRFANPFSRRLTMELNDGEATATGSSCGTNRNIGRYFFSPGDSFTFLCHGRDGFCVKWGLEDPSESMPQLGDWIGLSCKGSESVWKNNNNLRLYEFGHN